MMSPDLRNAVLCTDTFWKKIFLLIGKMHRLSSIIKVNKSFKWLNPLWSQSCLALICLQVFKTFPIILRRILSWKFVFSDPFLYSNIWVAFLDGTSFPLFIMRLELMPRWHTLYRSLFIFFRLFFFLTWWGVQMYTKRFPNFIRRIDMVL